MKKDWAHIEKWRQSMAGTPWASKPGDDYGMFSVQKDPLVILVIVATAGDPENAGGGETGEWEHVSVHVRTIGLDGQPKQRTPAWDEMCYVKDLFWEPEEAVVQYHPPMSQYVNTHSHVLHLWRPKHKEVPLPPQICV